MKLRNFRLGLAMLYACTALGGCDLLRHETRSESHDSASDDESDEESKPGKIKSEAPRGFFKSTRLPGGMSDEGREIERDLGIN
ncbi:hypothetical protein ACYOEI_02650 [Singulisphaera rosea]